MYGGDHSRKQTLVEYGFRLPAALDNRPMRMEEFEALTGQTIFVSATPADYELEKSEGVFVDQVISLQDFWILLWRCDQVLTRLTT